MSYALQATTTVTPAQITADQNNYAPPLLSIARHLRLSADAAHSITGLAGGSAHPAPGRVLYLSNVGAETLTLEDQHASSAAGNRFAFAAGDLALAAGCSVSLVYDGSSLRWRCTGKNF